MAESTQPIDLLPADGLTGLRLGVSVAQSPDLGRLGLVDAHLRIALGEVARTLLVSGGEIVYGGLLGPSGHTAFLRDELERHARRDRPLLACLAWPVHRALALADLRRAERDLGLYGRIAYLDPQGNPIDCATDRGEEPAPLSDDEVVRASLTALRERMAAAAEARLLVAGRRAGYRGRLPGVLEDALLAVAAGHPLYVAGGFGGMAADVGAALGHAPAGWPPFDADGHDGPTSDALAELADGAGKATDNGLDADENARLAVSHRPSEIASLVALGLGRLAVAGRI